MDSWVKVDLQQVVQSAQELIARWGLRLAGALVLLIAGSIVARVLRKSVRNALGRSALDATLTPFLAAMVYYGALAFTVIAALSVLGVATTSLVALLGAAGLAVGLALQGTLSSFAAGVMLLIFRPFKIGDYVEAGGTGGTVSEISIVSTKMNSPDNVQIIVPNASMFGQVLKNYSANQNRRIDLVVGISYDDDVGKAMQTVRRVLESDSRVLSDPAPVVGASNLGDSSVDLVVRPWCSKDDYWKLRFELIQRLKEELEAAGCSIPFPQRDVHLHQAVKSSV